MRGGGFFDEADKLETGIGNRRKTESEAGERDWKVKKEKLVLAGNAFGGVMKNPTLDNALGTLDYLGRNGVLPPGLVEQYRGVVQSDPTKIGMLAEQAYRSVLDADKQLIKPETRNLGGSTQTLGIDPVTGKATVLSTATNSMTPGEAARVGLDRERLEWDKNQPRGQVVQTDTGPILVDPRNGTARPVLGSNGQPMKSTKAPTEFQGKSAAFGARAEQADKILVELDGQYSPAGINAKNAASSIWGIGGALGAVGNRGLSDASQRADQAQRDFINAVLRQESGAAIGEGEFDNARKQYFPQPGDSAAVIKQKAANRRLAIQGLKSNAGPAAFSAAGAAPSQPAQQQPALPSGWSVEVH
jgi:hypothetical protein